MSPVLEPSHAQLQEQVTTLMGYMGWRFLHVRKSIGKGKRWTTATNLVGWPDLWAWHPRHGFLGVEIKVGRDKPTPEQVAVLASLAAAGARTAVIYPADFDRLKALLSGSPDPTPVS